MRCLDYVGVHCPLNSFVQRRLHIVQNLPGHASRFYRSGLRIMRRKLLRTPIPTNDQRAAPHKLLLRIKLDRDFLSDGPRCQLANSSARITTISDVRATSAYTFTYNSDSPPHLTAIRNNVQTGEAYNFTYSSQASPRLSIANRSATRPFSQLRWLTR